MFSMPLFLVVSPLQPVLQQTPCFEPSILQH